MPDAHQQISTERCDRCGARAKVRAIFASGVLHFCGHHYDAHEAALATAALTVIDEREPAAAS